MTKTFSRQIREAFFEDDLMTSIGLVKKTVQEHKDFLAQQRKDDTGLVLGRNLSILVDRLIRCMWDQLGWSSEHDSAQMSIVAVGGYGRQELCPKSDIDILFLTSKNLSENEKSQIEFFVQRLWDYGFDVGSSVRSIRQCWGIRNKDVTTWTSFLDERFVVGHFDLYQKFSDKIKQRGFVNHRRLFIEQKLKERQIRLGRYGGWNQFLEPNLKEVSGGLRDVHTILWIAKQKYDIRCFDDLVRYGVFRPKNVVDLENAYSYLLKTRWWLHFLTDSKNDILSFDYQKEVAGYFLFKEDEQQTKTQLFLGTLSFNIKVINRITSEFVSRWDQKWKIQSLYFKKNTNNFFKEKKGSLQLIDVNINYFMNDYQLMFDYFDIMNETGLSLSSIAHARLTQTIQYLEVQVLEMNLFLRRFLNIMKFGKCIEQTLYAMHDVGLIELIVPDFKYIHSHSQYSIYHIYTTDAHTLILLSTLSKLSASKDPKLTELVSAYSRINDLDVLYLACLFHDIGKGVEGNHSVTGAKMIEDYMEKQGFRYSQIKEASDLVFYHLEMNEIAQRRNIDDLETIENFAKKMKEPSVVHKLYVLTYCDTSSVHPDAWSDWKGDLLKKLYIRTLEYMKGSDKFLSHHDKESELIEQLSSSYSRKKIKGHLDLMPIPYVMEVSATVLAMHIKMLEAIAKEKISMNVLYHSSFIEVHILTQDGPDILSSMMGTFLKLDIPIIEAKIYTRQDGLVLDQFKFNHNKDTNKTKMFSNLKRFLKDQLLVFLESPELNLKAEINSNNHQGTVVAQSAIMRNFKVKFSNSISYDFSVIDISCYDFLGLNYLIVDALHQCQVQIHGANLTTEASRAFNSFYVTGVDYQKITNFNHISKIKDELKKVLKKSELLQ